MPNLDDMSAMDWLDGDLASVKDDIRRLGRRKAVQYNASLYRDDRADAYGENLPHLTVKDFKDAIDEIANRG